ncbi:MAG TPA: hypothetical protein VMU37_03705 [Caulobacteraceae bacterium]|nr:hypothetical protein [Caulobacteraceae bacterium]
MMLPLNLISANPTGASVIAWLGVVVLVLVAAVAVFLWVIVARRVAHRADSDLADEEASVEALRHTRLVVESDDKTLGPEAVEVLTLEHTDERPPPEGS